MHTGTVPVARTAPQALCQGRVASTTGTADRYGHPASQTTLQTMRVAYSWNLRTTRFTATRYRSRVSGSVGRQAFSRFGGLLGAFLPCSVLPRTQRVVDSISDVNEPSAVDFQLLQPLSLGRVQLISLPGVRLSAVNPLSGFSKLHLVHVFMLTLYNKSH